jgi:hypothetical protein
VFPRHHQAFCPKFNSDITIYRKEWWGVVTGIMQIYPLTPDRLFNG